MRRSPRLHVIVTTMVLISKRMEKQIKPDIRDLKDIILFVDDFYDQVRNDKLIGPIFDDVIKDWGPHLQKMYQFWNAAIFGVPGFKGNPFARHAPLPIDETHFERWLQLFRQTIDSHFEGPMATDTKTRAEIMAITFVHRLKNMKGGPGHVLV